MKIDDSFKKPGSVPFKWEIRPGVPKLQNPQPNPQFEFQKQHPKSTRLKPPPAGLSSYHPEMEPRANSFRASPRTPSSRRFGMPGFARPDVVSSGGCLPSPLPKRNKGKTPVYKPGSVPESEYYSDLDTPPRWSVSSRRSVSPFSSSFASYQSSPHPVNDAEWATFGLF